MADKLILYIGEKNISSWSMRGFLALAAKGLEFEERTISLREDKDRSKRRAVSSTGKVPVLHHAIGSATRVIPDSLAIIEYLEETFPSPGHPALWPSDPAQRAHARWLAAAMHSGFMKLRESMSFNLCFLPKRPRATDEALAEAAEIAGLWEEALAKKTAPGPFLFGPFGAADVMFAPVVWRLSAFEAPPRRSLKASGYIESVLAAAPVRRWMDPAREMTPYESY
ncbi:MAG TPA: glutathione S-transferase N-terminal domain-containing protein [Candidatus Polarisedimenticolia bacterium]|jgi:glutathione S-transferase